MFSEDSLREIRNIILELDNIHLSAGPLYQKVNCCKALVDLETTELEAIYNLTQSHSPGLRNKTVYQYEKLLADKSKSSQNIAQLELSKESLTIKCSTYPKKKKVQEMLKQIEEMPKEWTVVQLTPQYNPMEIHNEDNEVYYTNSIHISFFNCGTKDEPFYVTASAPKDAINGEKIELCKEIISIIKLNKEMLKSHSKKYFENYKEKHDYFHKVQSVEDRLLLLVKDLQQYWLKEWRCLLTGRYAEALEIQIKEEIINSMKTEVTNLKLTKKVETILSCVVKNYMKLKLNEVKNIVLYCFPEITDKNVIRNIVNSIRAIGSKHYIEMPNPKRNPVILILHDSLDYFPWEMMDVLENEPVCRLPSLHFLYCLFKEHESEIVEGYKIVKNFDKGAYVVNPTQDLAAMEKRMMAFLNYWTPNWTGISGKTPSKDEFFELLTSCNIFSYNGHGSGSHLISMDKLQKSFLKSVVLLFGCGSTRIVRPDPQTDMSADYYTYLIARCPCVVGMLWEVTDKSTDALTTDFMSYWIPCKANKHWKYVNKDKWQKEGRIVFMKNRQAFEDEILWEPDLLRALVLAKKNMDRNITKAACVVRGLPVKIIQS